MWHQSHLLSLLLELYDKLIMEMNKLTRIYQKRRRSRRRGRLIAPIADLSAPTGLPEYFVKVHYHVPGEASP